MHVSRICRDSYMYSYVYKSTRSLLHLQGGSAKQDTHLSACIHKSVIVMVAITQYGSTVYIGMALVWPAL